MACHYNINASVMEKMYHVRKLPYFMLGDLLNEDEVLQWLIEQKNSATIEEVTDEILEDLIEEHEYVVVYFSEYNLLGSINSFRK